MEKTSGPKDTEASKRQGAARERLERELEDVSFPVSKEELLDRKGDLDLKLGAEGESVRLRDILANVNADEFVSPEHVSEVVDIDWSDMADVYDPGGFSKPKPWKFGEP